ncbi:hypothetical protein GA0115254_114410 [Streptomyces sp. Ncost-T10-10d]|nr:hypothetical protein GA0115254_114410 [Streptomyces sp. Ncost-T10-10d]
MTTTKRETVSRTARRQQNTTHGWHRARVPSRVDTVVMGDLLDWWCAVVCGVRRRYLCRRMLVGTIWPPGATAKVVR